MKNNWYAHISYLLNAEIQDMIHCVLEIRIHQFIAYQAAVEYVAILLIEKVIVFKKGIAVPRQMHIHIIAHSRCLNCPFFSLCNALAEI